MLPMRVAVKILAGAVGLVVVLVIAAAIVVATVDVNTLIAPVTERVRAATGRELTVHGSAHLALSLEPKLVLDDVTLSNAPWAGAHDMVKAKKLELQVALLPLLSRRFELVQLSLVEPTIALETDAQGRHNWDMSPPPAAAGTAPGSGTASLPPALAAGNLGIVDGTITLRDGSSGAVTRIEVAQFAVRARSADAPISAHFRGKVDDVPVDVEGTFGPVADLLARRWPYPVSLQGDVAGQKTAISTKVRAVDRQYTLDDLKVAVGANALTGSFAATTGGARPRLVFDLSGPVLALDALPLPVTAAAPAAAPTSAPAKSGRAWLIPDTRVDFAPLRLVDAQGRIALGRLTLPGGRTYEKLQVALALDAGRLDVSSFSVAALGGTVAGTFTVDATRPDRAALRVHLDGRGMAIGAILAAVGQPREIKGGKTDVTVDLAMQGASPHAWASTATGSFRMVTGPADLTNSRLDPNSVLDKLSSAVNPFRAVDAATDLRCAVARFPLQDGIARVDRGIAMETSKLGVTATGTLDFRNETLEFTFQPKVRKGISIDIANLSEFVGISGPFASPQVRIDPVGSVKALASIGAAVGTGGLSAVGQALFSWAESNGPGPCAIAEGAAAAPAAKQGGSTATSGGNPAADLGKAIGRLFGK